jgi:superfamily II DNA/RNA helicase
MSDMEPDRDLNQRGLPLLLILEPTRELAIQVAEELKSVCKAHRMGVLAIYGGSSFSDQGDHHLLQQHRTRLRFTISH